MPRGGPRPGGDRIRLAVSPDSQWKFRGRVATSRRARRLWRGGRGNHVHSRAHRGPWGDELANLREEVEKLGNLRDKVAALGDGRYEIPQSTYVQGLGTINLEPLRSLRTEP